MRNRPDIEQAVGSIAMIRREACPKNSPGYEGGIKGNIDSVQGSKEN
ncbi:MAG: hypothetical protein ACREOB_04100 [Thermodesulfobacteriota bacterium]